MERILKSKLVTCILILTLASSILVLGYDDVIVKDGALISAEAYITSLYAHYGDFAYDVDIGGELTCYKIDYEVSDPAGTLYDQKTRLEIIGLVKGTIPPDKQSGAMVFFNKETKRLETYVPGEGKFYDLQGKLLHTMPTIDVATDYKIYYYLHPLTGEVKARQKVVVDKYRIKKGYRLDRETGHFINTASGEIVPKETAVELIKAL